MLIFILFRFFFNFILVFIFEHQTLQINHLIKKTRAIFQTYKDAKIIINQLFWNLILLFYIIHFK